MYGLVVYDTISNPGLVAAPDNPNKAHRPVLGKEWQFDNLHIIVFRFLLILSDNLFHNLYEFDSTYDGIHSAINRLRKKLKVNIENINF